MTSLIERMKMALEMATPGEWWSSGEEGYNIVWKRASGRPPQRIARAEFPDEYGGANAAYIALASPANLRSIIQALEGAEKSLAHIQDKAEFGQRGQFGIIANEAHAALTLIREVTGSQYMTGEKNADAS